jgi:hydrogenase maturation factor
VSALAPGHCITCSDEAVAAEVVAVDGLSAIVLVQGREEQVGVDLVPDAAPGDRLLCHAGIALERLEEQPGRPAEAGHLPAR